MVIGEKRAEIGRDVVHTVEACRPGGVILLAGRESRSGCRKSLQIEPPALTKITFC